MTTRSLLVSCLVGCVFPAWQAPAFGQSQGARRDVDASSPEDDRERQIVERFVALLERTPRRGTALDRVYGYHVERGTLEAFLKAYRDRVEKDPKDGAAWLILGLFESQRGRDAAAVAALRLAETHRPADPLPCYYLGQALVLVGQPEGAAEAFERAIARKPARADLLEVYQALGRSYQRTRRDDKAMAVWGRLEAQFPDDLRVKEQIADALAEESQFAQALPRYEALAKAVKDKYRQVQFRIEAAELRVRLGKAAEALADFEGLLGQLNPDSWLYREVRRKIEEVFLRNDDLAGLAAYYEGWIKKTPDDVEALARLGRTLANQGRAAEARGWLEKAVKLAPSRRELRLALIDQLVQEGKFADAAKQYEALSQADPRNLDVVREWGRLILKDESRPLAGRRESVSAVWRRLTEGDSPDPLVVAQVADLFRQAEMRDEAIALYKRAVALAPEASQYREYLGEYYHTLKRRDEALATWGEIAAGPRKDAKNLARLGEVLAGFGYRTEAVAAFAEACRLDDDELDLRLKHADALLQLERYDDALGQLDAAEKLADDEDQGEAVLQRQIKAYQGGNTLAARTEALRTQLDAGEAPTADRWLRLARFLEADQKLADAAAAVRKAAVLEPRSVPARVAAARIFEMAGDLSAASAALRELTVIDRRARSEYLANLAKLEARLGRREASLAAGRELLAAAPGNVDTYQTFADLCFQLGEADEGLDALRRSVRANPSDPKVATALAEALAQQFRTDEAIELYWRAYEKTPELDAKVGTVARLTELYLQQNQFDRLVARLERMQHEPEKQREASLGLAQAYSTSGDLGTARQELERLLAANARDTHLLGQLSALSEAEGDLAAAVKFQRQLVDLAPGDEATARLAQLHLQSGDVAEAQAAWERLAGSGRDPSRTLQAIDSLLGAGNREAVLKLTEPLIRKRPDDWEALAREGLALSGLGRTAEAARRFQAVLALPTPDDDQSAIVKARARGGSARPTGAVPVAAAARAQPVPLQSRSAAIYQLRGIVGLDPRYAAAVYRSSGYSWSPSDFGQARMAALAWLFSDAQKEKSAEAFLAQRRAARDNAPRDPRPAWDWYYLQVVRQEYAETYEAAKFLAKQFPNDTTSLWAYLSSLTMRLGQSAAIAARTRGAPADSTLPLPGDELDRIVSAFDSLKQRRPDWIQGVVLAGTLAELKRAGRKADEERIYRAAAEAVNDQVALTAVMLLASERGDVEGALKLLDTNERLQKNRSTALVGSYSGPAYSLMRIFETLAVDKNHAAIPRVIDRYLLSQRRIRLEGRRPRSSTALAQPARNRYVIASAGGSLRSTQVDYPHPNAYMEQDSLSLLRSAFELYRRDDLTSDLVSAYRTRRDKAESDAERLEAHLVLWALDWWNDDQEAASEDLARAVAISKGDPELSLALADLHERRQEPDEALALIDGIEALDNTTLQRREMAALRLSVSTGNIDRARAACDRLFGLRLDTDSQTMLAGQMHQLGMHDQAEAVLARARRRAGQRTATLVSLMGEYQRQDKLDKAVQVAHQILRRGSGRQMLPPGYSNPDDAAREQAVRLLARSGKLRDTIERLEAQAERSPNALVLQQSLADYYRASGDREKLRATYERMVKIRPDDARLRFQVASQLVQSGNAAASLVHFREAIAREPSLLSNNQVSTVQSAFVQAKKTDEFLQLLEAIDPRAISDAYGLSQVTSTLLQDPATRDRGRKLFQKFWDAYPEIRGNFIQNHVYDDGFWNVPEAYDLARQAITPTVLQSRLSPWYGLANTGMMYMGDGRVVGLLTRLLAAARQQGKAAELAREIEGALKDRPGWTGGKAILAVLKAREGRLDEARADLKPLLDDASGMNAYQARWMVAQELEDLPPLQDLVLALYEAELKVQGSPGNSLGSSSPLNRMIAIHQRAGRTAEARALVRRMSTERRDYSNYPPEYAAGQRVSELGQMAARLLELGATLESIRLYGEMMAAAEQIPADTNYYMSREQGVTQAKAGLEKALGSVKAEALGPLVESLLEPAEDAKPGKPALDLVLLVQPRELDQATVFSLLEALLGAAAGQPGGRAKAQAKLEVLAQRAPDDIPVNVALTLVALGGGDPEAIGRATKRLAGLAERTPLDPLPPGGRANARHREQAAAQLGLWLVARACWKVESIRDRGDVFATRALEAARRQLDPRWALAIHREWGQVALDRGDRATAEKRWSAMLDLILATTKEPRPAPKPARPSTAPPAPAPAAPVPVPAKAQIKKVSQLVPAPPPPATPAGTTTVMTKSVVMPSSRPAATSERFELATQMALMAAERGMPTLSLRAVREALRAGPPMSSVAVPSPGSRPRIISGRAESTPAGAVATVVEKELSTLVAAWRKHGVSAGDVYQVLRDCVLPPARAGEVFLYPRPLMNNRVYPPVSLPPRSAGLLLVQAAVEAGRVDELRRAIEERRARPTAEPSASVLLAQLAMASADDAPAIKVLGDLKARLGRDTLQNSAELACHAALPGLEVPALAGPAADVLEGAVKNLSTVSAEEPTWTLQRVLARHWFAHGEAGKALRAMEDALSVTDRELGRISGNVDYVTSRRKQGYLRVATEYAAAGQVAAALELLGRYCDTPAERESYGNEATSPFLPLVRHLGALPAAERYERLKAWTLPTPTRASTRVLGSFVTFDAPPAPFQTPKVTPSCEQGVASTVGLLLEAAREVGKLEGLADELKQAVDRKVEGAQPLYVLALLARGQVERVAPLVSALADEIHASVPDAEEIKRLGGRYVPGGRLVQWADYLVARACLAEPGLSSIAERMAEDMEAIAAVRYQSQQFAWPLRVDVATSRRSRGAGKAPDPEDGQAGLAYWLTGGRMVGYYSSSGPRAVAWAVHENHLAYEGGNPPSLAFALPLTGPFEFSVEAFIDAKASPTLSYGGTQVTVGPKGEGYAYGSSTANSYAVRYTRFIKPDDFNRITVAVESGRVRFLVNGHLYHEHASPSKAVPWLTIGGMQRAVYRNPRISGSPVVPRRVELSDGRALDGWNSSFYNESSGPPRAVPERALISLPRATARTPDLDWSIREGVITGRRSGQPWPRSIAQSRLELARALRDGDVLSYEFYHAPDSVTVHPALGRLAFLLEPGGVRLHWMTPGRDVDDWTGLKPGNVLDDPGHRRGPAPLPLKANDWNAVKVGLDAGTVRLTLNDVVVYERPLGPDAGRTFSLYHDKDRTEARVRSVVLEGQWPETAPTGAVDLFAMSGPEDEATRRGRHAAVGEAVLVRNAGEVLRRSRTRPAAQRYEALAAWVLPGADHPTFRLQGDFRPVDPVPTDPTESSPDRGGKVEAPALELVAVAKGLGKLDELDERVRSAAPGSDLDRRGQLALGALIRSARGRDADALAILEQLRPLVAKVPADAPDWQRWPELVALSSLPLGPRVGPVPLLDALADVPVKGGAPLPRWLRHARHLRAIAGAGPAGDAPASSGWIPVVRGRAETRGQGDPPSVWTFREGQWTRSPGDGEDTLDFSRPLRAPFDVEAELASSPTARTQIEYGGLRFGLDPKGTTLQVSDGGRALPDVPLVISREKAGPWHAFRLAVRDRSLTVSIDGRKVHERPLAEAADPWLSIRGAAGMAAMARGMVVTGSPSIPRVLGLSEATNLNGWSAGYYNEATSGVNGRWEKRGEEILGAAMKSEQNSALVTRGSGVAEVAVPTEHYALIGSASESVLQHRRPLLAGDEVEYDFYFDPGKVAVHPALDRLTFLLEPDGVKAHWMTDAQYDRSGRAPDNAVVEPEYRRGPKSLPLKPGEWNRLKLSLSGDRAAIALNDVTVYERPLDRGNSRTFGLFHFADQSEVRVRKVMLRGGWPEKLVDAPKPADSPAGAPRGPAPE